MVRFLAPPINHVDFSIEFFYAAMVVFFCILIYFKTKELFSLTKHKGIRYFRNAFLLFAATYFVQFLLKIVFLGFIIADNNLSRNVINPFMFFIVGFLSTLAIIHFLYSMYWKKITYTFFMTFSIIFSLLISLLGFVTKSPLIVALFQLPLIIMILVSSLLLKKKSRVKIMYILISSFWLIELLILHSRRLLPFELRIIFQIMSLGIFFYLWYRVKKWTK